jgi:single-strand DNA-binding protein
MMNIKNHVQLVGRLGANPEVKMLENGTKVARFSVAVSNYYTNKQGEKVADVQWHAITAWGTLANVAERLLFKGTQVTVDGKLNNRTYINKEGRKVSTTEVIANELFVLQNKPAAVAA